MLAGYRGTMEDIPVHWHDTAVRLGLLTYTEEEKKEAWIQAAELARAEMARRAEEEENIFNARAILKRLEANDYDGLRIAYAKKILLCKVIQL